MANNMYEDLKVKVVKLYNCKGDSGDLKRLSSIYGLIEAAKVNRDHMQADLEATLKENEELKKQIEALKKQGKEPEKEAPKQETSDVEFLKALEVLGNIFMEALVSGDTTKK